MDAAVVSLLGDHALIEPLLCVVAIVVLGCSIGRLDRDPTLRRYFSRMPS